MQGTREMKPRLRDPAFWIALAMLVVLTGLASWKLWNEFKPIGPPKPTEEYSGAKEVPYR